jgi:hypothetical protein
MRGIGLSVLAPAIFSANLIAAPLPGDLKSIPEPTAKDLAAAKEAYGKLGAEYESRFEPRTKLAVHSFQMPKTTTDADLMRLPILPFRFALSLYKTKVTDAGMKELKQLKYLVLLDLSETQVTDVGLTEVKELRNLTILFLERTKVTDDGLADLKQLKNLTYLDLD